MTITHVQSGISAASANTLTVTLAGAPANGNLLVCVTMMNSGTTTVQGTWNAFAALLATGAGPCQAYWKLAGAGESATQNAANLSGSISRAVVVSEYNSTTGWDASPVEASTQNTDADTTKTTTGACDPTDAVERLIWAWAVTDGNRVFSAHKVNGSTTGVTERESAEVGTTNAGETASAFDRIDTSTVSGSYTAEAICSGADSGAVGIAIFKPTAGAAAAPRLTPAILRQAVKTAALR